jgi:ketosteroid isomerase-like protein
MMSTDVRAVAGDVAALADSFVAAWNDHDLDRIMAFYTENAVLRRQPPFDGGRVYRGKDEIRGWVAPLLPGFHATRREHRAPGDTVAWDETVTYDALKSRGVDTIDVAVDVTLRGDQVASTTVLPSPEAAARLGVAT